MPIILGGIGQLGSALAQMLLDKSEKVAVVTRHSSKTEDLEAKGFQVEVADVHDIDRLRSIFRKGKHLFLFNPPADPSTDTDKEERKTVKAILEALENSGKEKNYGKRFTRTKNRIARCT